MTRNEINARVSQIYVAVLSEFRGNPGEYPNIKQAQDLEARRRAMSAAKRCRALLEAATQETA